MKPEIRSLLERTYDRETERLAVEEGLIRLDRPGHTKEIAHLAHCREGRQTAHVYAFGTLLGRLGEAEGGEMLRALAKLQRTDRADPHYGGFRWYAEESNVNDTNAAFFIVRPLVLLRLWHPEAIPASHARIMDDMLAHAGEWFRRECLLPTLYYPNKIVSDGAMLLAVSAILGREEYVEAGIRFFERWEDYTERRGWGWGENMSVAYIAVIVISLQIAATVLDGRMHSLGARLRGRIEELYGMLRFHDGEEPVPAIRSYNFSGETVRPDPLWVAAGVRGIRELDPGRLTLNGLLLFLPFGDELAAGSRTSQETRQPVPRERTERIFDDSRAYSWIGRHTRLGSLNRFPVIPGSYQWPTWGLGWQSFPASFSVAGEQLSFVRWYVDLGDEVRTHPGESYRTSYLAPALFRESFFPDVQTRSAQAGNVLLTVRSMSGVHNRAAAIADEWVVHRYAGRPIAMTTRSDGREWQVLPYPRATVALTALRGIPCGREERVPMRIAVEPEKGRLKLRQVLLERNGAAETVVHPRLEAGWAVVVLDGEASLDAVAAYLETVRIRDVDEPDGEVPRAAYAYVRDIRLSDSGGERVRLQADPYGV
ncbi:hypothetical protein [Paenibacillus flagellatus]|uniref:Heparinase n=1 Tax=Paenibacillus flagellatus TaxID=2211139 RepID=A0A2V5KGT2_9BACL|nr:hypothetical protein [Paenibacillus flagellatus]PYI53440.1 hypothetical protein DLM86_16830 [Paenibacillus flagellatus]